MEADHRAAQLQSPFSSITKGPCTLGPLGATALCPHPELHPSQAALPAGASSYLLCPRKMNYLSPQHPE